MSLYICPVVLIFVDIGYFGNFLPRYLPGLKCGTYLRRSVFTILNIPSAGNCVQLACRLKPESVTGISRCQHHHPQPAPELEELIEAANRVCEEKSGTGSAKTKECDALSRRFLIL